MKSGNDVIRTLRDVRGQRYGEILLVKNGDEGLLAEVYNTFTLNDCPQDTWDALDLVAIAERAGALVAVANGPRYWLVDTIEKSGPAHPDVRSFGGLSMTGAAIVHLGTAGVDTSAYTGRRVARTALFRFDEGSVVYELVDHDGAVYIMQSWCTAVDPLLAEPALAALGDRLHIPAGWRYRSRVLGGPLEVMTTTEDAVVLQDELRNSYCLEQ